MALSQNDKLVLGALFDSEGSTKNVASIDTGRPSLPGISYNDLQFLQDREKQAILPLNTEQPSHEQIENAIAGLTVLVQEFPNYASAYNNRAQAIRMLVGDDLLAPAVAATSLYSDLCKAIELALPTPGNPSVSSLQANILSSAYTHRATLLLKCSRSITTAKAGGRDLPEELRGADSQLLERMAGKDFQSGGKYGNSIAKTMAVQLNPYAKMCGEIVKEAMIADMKESMPAMGERA